MTNNNYPNIKSLIFSVLALNSISNTFKEFRKKFIINVLVYFSGIKGKINFLQMQRFSENYEQYIRIAFNPGCIPKSVEKTYGPDSYRSDYAKGIGLETIDCPLACREFMIEEWIVRLNNCKLCV